MFPENTALLLIDIQNDFCPGGALAVPAGDEVVAIANQLIPKFKTVVASQDYHPENHASFAAQYLGKNPGDMIELHGKPQILWPAHCVQNTSGALLHPDLDLQSVTKIFKKGTCVDVDSYSAFYDNHRLQNTGLTDWLKKRDITTLYVMGLATDYCVNYSCLDAVSDGFFVNLIKDGCRGINLAAGDVENALAQMQENGVKLVNSKELLMD